MIHKNWSKGICQLLAIAFIYQNINSRVWANQTTDSQKPQTVTTSEDSQSMDVFPVGVNIGKRNLIPSIMIRGKEDGEKAINFENWLIPYEAVIQALKLKVKTLPDSQLQVRSPGIVTRIDPKKLGTDTELGLVFSIADLQQLFGIKAKFDINEYAIVIEIPWQNRNSSNTPHKETPIILDGLPRLKPGRLNLAAVEQKVTASGGANNSTNYRGDFTAVGTAFGGSWFIRTDQQKLFSRQSWKIGEAQFLKLNDGEDYFLGSQPTFWQSQETGGDYWGFTFVKRQGFAPSKPFGGGTSEPSQRLQAAQIPRTISGKAEPGTLVRLVPGLGERVIAEVLVNSSGIYRFENINSDDQIFGSNYRVLLYPQGRLTAQPEIREATFTTVTGQIPAGTSAWVVSGGLNRNDSNSENPGFLGNFSGFRGGIAARWGLSSNLTVGLGGLYDESFKGLTELYYRPKNFPLQIAVSALIDKELDAITDIRYEPFSNFSATFSSDKFSNRFNADWRLSSNFSLFAATDSRDATSAGVQINFSGKDAYTFARASFDSKNRFRWNLLQRLGKLELTQRGNEIGTLSELTYNLSTKRLFDSGNSLLLSYETRNQNSSDNLLSLAWRYRSQQRAVDGNYFWEAQLGYGIGSQGSGIMASLGTTVLPGLMLRGRYEGVSLTSNKSTFSVDLISSLNLQKGFSPGDRRSDYFRTQGGLLIQPFLDRNSNGKRDGGEKVYTENSELLLLVNNKSIKSLQPEIQGDRILLRLPPGDYRLDLDPAGFPADWQPLKDAYAVQVVAGSRTAIQVPLTLSYTISGVVTNTKTKKPINGARVEAISKKSSLRKFSVTNGAGVYYLEGLEQGEYELQINGKPAGKLKLQESSEPFQELNLSY